MERSDRGASRRHFIDHRKVQVTVQRHRQCPRDWRCRHDERIRVSTFGHELQALNNTKPMLFINDHEAEVLENRVLLDESMRADNDLGLAGGDLRQ